MRACECACVCACVGARVRLYIYMYCMTMIFGRCEAEIGNPRRCHIRCSLPPRTRVSLARENEAGAVGRRKSIFSMLTYKTLFFFFLMIELFPNSVFQFYCPKDYYKQKQ